MVNTFFAYERKDGPGWRVIDERTDTDAFGPTVVAINKHSAVQLINDRGPAQAITRAPNVALDGYCHGGESEQ